jgi:plasmid stabilization system protein ParE
MVERIVDAIETLNTFPHRSVVHDPEARLPHPVRMLPVRPYVVYFRVQENEGIVRILTIRHGARRRPRRL